MQQVFSHRRLMHFLPHFFSHLFIVFGGFFSQFFSIQPLSLASFLLIARGLAGMVRPVRLV